MIQILLLKNSKYRMQLDTDENLVEKKENKTAQYLLIGICCFIVLLACFLLYKTMSSSGSAVSGGGK